MKPFTYEETKNPFPPLIGNNNNFQNRGQNNIKQESVYYAK